MIHGRRRRLLWTGVGGALAAMALTAIVAVIAGDFGDTFWRTIGTVVILFTGGAAALAGLELAHRRQLRLLGWALLVVAPACSVTLLVADWKSEISTTYANALVMTVLVLLAGLAVATLRLIVDLSRPVVLVLFSAVCLCTAALVGLGVPLIWVHDPPDAGIRALLILIVLVVIGYALTPVVQRLAHASPGRSE